MGPTRLAPALLVLAAATGCGSGSGGGGAAASCAAPYLDDRPAGRPQRGDVPTVRTGTSVVVHGHWYTTTCNDTGGDDPISPMPPVRLEARLPGGTVVPLGRFEVGGEDAGFTTRVDVPLGTPAGLASVCDDQETPSVFRFRVAPAG